VTQRRGSEEGGQDKAEDKIGKILSIYIQILSGPRGLWGINKHGHEYLNIFNIKSKIIRYQIE
jgi:hypothetical protein